MQGACCGKFDRFIIEGKRSIRYKEIKFSLKYGACIAIQVTESKCLNTRKLRRSLVRYER